jgi:signal transduction histidine kinase
MAISNPAIQGILEIVNGIIIVINEYRQIVAINDTFQEYLGILDPDEIFGMRPGEAISCAYANDSTRGCGAGGYCHTCGAVIAVHTAQETGKAADRKVALRIQKDGRTQDICLHVRAFPVDYNEIQFIVVFMQDITDIEKKYELERVFYHDITNSVNGLIGACQLLKHYKDDNEKLDKYSTVINRLSYKLSAEIKLQQQISSINEEVSLSISEIELSQFLNDIAEFVGYHPTAKGRSIVIVDPIPKLSFQTDEVLLDRIIINMLINACEASREGEAIRLQAEHSGYVLTISVWNQEVIEPKVALRIFQRHFTTKQGNGRGFGTYAMKLLGESCLKGKVSFTSKKSEGTTFNIKLKV